MIRTLKYITYGTVLIAIYFAGIYTNQLLQIPSQPTNFADTTSAIAALVGVLVATTTITNWKKSKIQEDSYQIIKSYVAELVLIETTVYEILIENTSICPLAGNIVPSQAFVAETFQNIDALRKTLSKQHRKIHQTKNELQFWGGKLTKIHEDHHEELMKELYNFQVVADCLRNNLQNYFTNGLTTIQQVLQEYEKLSNYHLKINTTLAGRKNNKMSEMFTIEG
ncbi:hypothetical protein [Pseudomonas sp. S09G 359]|jgi:uncharacterized protein YbcI|uniref:hypothetical protein n=1 Tax=Pseudomonas sp. S09G 359 TaxID=2054919 RepID=UPI000C6DB410|nr:hypothetical protein [Pseudomonas sp. S09G 359]AUG08162.1 hypothetical protein CXQ82_16810 [Pseudomonas sp. S09G 359]